MKKKRWYVSLLVVMFVGAAAAAVPVTDGLIIHLKAEALNLNDGDPVTVWPDSAKADAVDGTVYEISGRGVPRFSIAGYNGFPAVRFSTAQELLDSNVWTWDASKGVTVLGVFTGGTARGIQRVCQVGNGTGTNHQVVGADMVSNQTGGGSGLRYNNGNALTTAANNPMTSGFHICAWQVNQGARYDAGKMYVDGSQIVWDTYGGAANIINFQNADNKITIGNGRLNGGALSEDWYDGYIAEILVFNAQLTESQIQTMQAYLENKYLLSAHNPAPEDGSFNQGTQIGGGYVDVEFSWYTGLDPQTFSAANEGITSHYFYLVADEPNFVDVTPIVIDAGSPVEPIGSYGPVSLQMDKTYYWRVEESVNGSLAADPNTIVGAVWSFETTKSVPVITDQPAHVLAEPGQAVAFTLAVVSNSPPDFKWYKSADNANDTPFDDELVSMDQTLAIEAVQANNEGYYYCVVTNESGEANAAYSNVAKLGVRRNVAHWTLDWADFVDGRYLDVSGNGHHADPNLLPDAAQFVDGVDPAKTGQALDMTLEPLSAAQAGEWAAAAFTNQVTVSAWVKWAGPNNAWQGIVSNRVTPTDGNFFFEIRQDNGNVQFAGPNFNVLESVNLPVGQWTHLAATASTAGIAIYMNGERVGWRTPTLNASIRENIAPLYIGALGRSAGGMLTSPFNGIMDDVRIYNYVKDQYGIVDLYYDVTEIPLCLNPGGLDLRFDIAGGGPDGDQPDCKVTLVDFAVFAQTWLNCAYYPQQACP